MSIRIDADTTVPLGLVIAIIVTATASVATGTFWISSVNDRLARIEEKLGIPPTKHALATIGEARASETERK